MDDARAGRRARAVEDPDIVEPEKATLEDVATRRVLAVHPPGEIDQELVEDAFEEGEIAAPPAPIAVDLEHAKRRPGVHRRIGVAEFPFVGRQLAVRMHVPFARQQQQLALGKLGIEMG